MATVVAGGGRMLGSGIDDLLLEIGGPRDGVALVFDGTELSEVVTARDGATAYRVEPAGEAPLDARPL